MLSIYILVGPLVDKSILTDYTIPDSYLVFTPFHQDEIIYSNKNDVHLRAHYSSTHHLRTKYLKAHH